MSSLFKAVAAFAFAALVTGSLHIDNARWRTVAAELHQANPRARLASQFQAFHLPPSPTHN